MPDKVETSEKMNILLVDDQPEGLLALEAILQDLDQNLMMARSAREALRHLLAEDFAVILLDVQMPDMDGYETAALIREKQRCRHTPIIFLTASHKTDVQIMRGYAVGAVDYMLKPLDPTVLRSKVSVFVELARKTELIRKQTEQLRQRELEARLLAEGRAELLSALERKNSELEAFSYSVSHDLRAPLRSIDGFSQLLIEDYAAKLDAKGQDYLRRVCMSAQRMGELIDDLLQLSRVGRAELNRDQIDLSSIARVVTEDLKRKDPGRQVTLCIQDKVMAEADSRLMRVVFDNLLGNAWKFTAKVSEAQIQFGAEHREDCTAFFIRDNGAGFNMSYAENLFRPFQRLHAESDFPGTGIGLATVHRIIDRHGGRIWADGALNRGAAFYFTIPPAGRGGHP